MLFISFWKNFLLSLFLSNIFTYTESALESDSEHLKLIVKAAQLFFTHNDLIKEGYEVFIKQLKRHTLTFISEKWEDKIFTVNVLNGVDDLLLVIDKSEDGLGPSETHTHIVLLKSSRGKKYTAHKAYIRTIEGEKSVEWDFYEVRPQLNYKNFFTAVAPTEYFQSKLETNKTADDKDSRQGRVYGFLAHLKGKIKDVACLVTVFIPRWCEKSDRPALGPAPDEDISDHDDNYSDEKISDTDEDHGVSEKSSEHDGEGGSKETSKKSDSREAGDSASEERDLESETSHELESNHDGSNFQRKQSKQSGRSMKRVKADHQHNSATTDEKMSGSKEPYSEDKSDDHDSMEKSSRENSGGSKKGSDANHHGKEHGFRGKFQKVNKQKKPHILEPGSSSSEESDESDESHESIIQQKKSGRSISKLPKDKILPKSPENVSNFICPSGSGAILLGNRCYCPMGTVLQSRKCFNRSSTADEEAQSTSERKKFKEADAHNNFDNSKSTLTKRQTHSENDTDHHSFIADVVEHPWLGPFYLDLLRVHFSKEKAAEIMKKVPKNSFDFFKDRYKIKNNRDTGHPEFESKKLPFTGIMDCKYDERKLQSFNGTIQENIVDFFLHSLRAQCHRRLRKNTLNLFKRDIVFVHKNVHNHIVELNTQSELIQSQILNKQDWQDFMSAIFLSKFSEAFAEQKVNLDKRIDDNISPDRKHISLTVRTLTVLMEKIMRLLKQKEFQSHAVKITKALVMTMTEYTQNFHKQQFIVNLYCKGCKREHILFHQNMKQLSFLSDYIMFGFQDIVRESLTFDEFYMSVVNSEATNE